VIYALWTESTGRRRGFLVAKKRYWRNGYSYTKLWHQAHTTWTLEGCKNLMPLHTYHKVEIITLWRWLLLWLQ
jgi:hypothetical protein